MKRGKSRDSNTDPLQVPHCRSVSRGGLRDLGNRLYEKGFNITTMPSVKRRESQEKLENPLAVTLTSFESRRRKQATVIKKQSTVFPTCLLRRSETTDNLLKKTPITKLAVVESQRPAPIGEKPNKPTRYLIDKFSGKFNINRRYNNTSADVSKETPQYFTLETHERSHDEAEFAEDAPIEHHTKPESNLDKYIKLIQKKTMYIDEFLYLKKAEYDQRAQQNPDPYDLKVVDYEVIKAEQEETSNSSHHMKEYFTISKKGLCHYVNNKPVEFMPLTEWISERDTYNRIKNLKFFVKFRKWKTVKMWKRNVIRHKIEMCSKLLQEKLFLLNPDLRSTLLSLKENSLKMSSDLTFLTTRQSDVNGVQETTFNLESFKAVQERKRRQCVREISKASRENRQKVSEGFKNCLAALLDTQKKSAEEEVIYGKKNFTVATSNKANRRDNAYQQLGFGLKMSYEARSELRKECSKFVRFSYLVDFLFQQSLGDIYDQSVQQFIRRLEQLHSNTEIRVQDEIAANHRGSMLAAMDSDSLLQIRLVPAINMQAIKEADFTYEDALPFEFALPEHERKQQFSLLYHMNIIPPDHPSDQPYEIQVKRRRLVPEICRKWLQLKPSCEEILAEINHCIHEGLNSLKHFKRWSKHIDMQKYVNVLEEWDDVVSETWEIAPEECLNPSHLLETYGSDQKFQRISHLLKKSFERSAIYICQKFTPFLTAYYQNEQVDFSLFSHPGLMNLSETIEMSLQTLEQQREQFARAIPITTSIGMLKLDSFELKQRLLPNPSLLLERIRSMLPELVHQRTLESKAWLKQQTENLSTKGDTIEEYIRQINNLKLIQQQFVDRRRQIDNLYHLYQIMSRFKVEIKDKKPFAETLAARDELQNVMNKAENTTVKENQKFAKHVRESIVPNLQSSLAALSDIVLDGRFLTLGGNEQDLLTELNRLRDRYNLLDREKERCVVYQKTLGLPDIDFSTHQKVRQQIESRIGLWQQKSLWEGLEKNWLSNKIWTINVKSMLQETEEINKRIAQLSAGLPENPLGQLLHHHINQLLINLPIVAALRCQYLKEDHWSDIKQISKMDLQCDKNLTLQQLIDLRVDQYREAIIEIAYIAEKEYELQCRYEQAQQGWLNLTIKIVNYKGRSKTAKETMLLHDTIDFMRQLEDLVSDILTITSNKYSKSIRVKAGQLKNTLINTHTYFTEWIRLQEQWKFFDILFSAVENKRLHENGLFEQVDKTFRSVMTKALTKSKVTLVHKLMQINAVPLEKIREVRDSLELVFHPINEYLNDKRRGFSRFYFVDNQQLLDMASNLTPDSIEKVAAKCFRGLQRLNFEGERIVSLTTLEGDTLKKNAVSTVGEIDQIFSSIQDIFSEGLRKLMKNSKSQEDDRRRWIGLNPAQSVLTIAKVEFTLYTEITISNKQSHQDSLTDYLSVFCKDLQQLIDDVLNGATLQPSSSANKQLAFYSNSVNNSRGYSRESNHRNSLPVNTLNYLKKFQLVIAQDIFHRDILEQLTASSICNTNQFLWQKHLRYYWDDSTEDNLVVVRHLLHSMRYGSDYVSMEDRCIPTLSFQRLSLKVLFAFNHHTNLLLRNHCTLETVENLGSSLGYNTHRYQCSAMTSESLLLQFMMGVHNTGSWGTIVHVHLLPPAVLSMLAHTLEQVNSLLVKNEKRKEADFKPQVGFVLTVAPNQPIPEQLVGLYRQIGLNQMHLSETLRIKLHSLGLQHFSVLARKLAKFYDVLALHCHHQVSQRKFLGGLQKLKASGLIDSTLQGEKQLIVGILVHWLKGTFPGRVVADVMPTISDLFQIPAVDEQSVTKPPRKSSVMSSPELQLSLNKLNLTYVPSIETHLKELSVGLESKDCVIVTGEASWKSSLINLLALTQTEEVKLHHINKSIISADVLFGGRLKKGHEAQYSEGRSTIKGILAEILEIKSRQPTIKPADSAHPSVRQISEKQLPLVETCQNWLVFEGYELNEADGSNEHLVKHLIRKRQLLYNKGRCLSIPNMCRIIIECCSLSNIDPAVVVVSAIKTVEWNEMLQKALIRGWITSNTKNRPASFVSYLEKYMGESLPLLFATAKDFTGLSELTLLNTLLTLLSSFINDIKEAKQLKIVFAVCVVWAFFGTVCQENRLKVDLIVRKQFEGVFPSAQSVYKFYINQSTFTLKQFGEKVDGRSLPPEIGPCNRGFINTMKSLPLRYLLNKYINIPARGVIALTGPQGSGKTTLLKSFFYSDDPDVSNNRVTFHREFTPSSLRTCILSKLDTYRKKLVTPMIGYHETRILIDDVWMKQENNPSCIEVLRCLIDKQGLYCQTAWKEVVGLRLAIAGRCELKSQRIGRHCLNLSLHLDDQDLVSIFTTQILKKLPNDDLKKLADTLATSALRIYRRLQEKLNRRFFHFNDICRLIDGLASANLKDVEQLKKYWWFSLNEVFNKVKDSQLTVQEIVASQLVGKIVSVQPSVAYLPLFSSIARNHNKDQEIRDIKRLMMQTNERIEQYNKENRNLPIIEYITEQKTLDHVIRLYRNIATGNCILFGKKNSGRSNTAKIVSFMRGYQYRVMRPSSETLLNSVVEWHQAFQKDHCTLVVPVEDSSDMMQQVVKFFSPEFYESVGIELNKEEILKNEALQKYCHEHSIRNIVEFFKQQKGRNLHIVLLISDYRFLQELMQYHPHVGSQFSIDYFGEWPQQTFASLAEVNLIDERLSEAESKELKEAAATAMQVHSRISKYVQCSMKQYEDYIKLFVELYRQLNCKLETQINTYRESFERAVEYGASLISSTERIDGLRRECTKLSGEMNSLRQSMRQAEGQDIFLAMQKLNRLNREMESYYDKLVEALEKRHSDIRKTVGMLESIEEEKIKNLRNTLVPGAGITQVMELLMIILGKEPDLKDIKQSMGSFRQFLAELKSLSAKTMTQELVRRFRDHAKKEEINNEVIKKLQFGMEFLNMLIAVKNYITERDRNVEINNEIRSREKQTAGVRQIYPDIDTKMVDFDRKQKILEQLLQRKSQVEKEIIELSSQKITQEKILQVVHDECEGWCRQYKLLEERKKTLTSDVLLMAGQFVYTSHLPIVERKRIMAIVRAELALSSNCTLYEHLNVDPQTCDSVTAESLVFENMICINNSIKTFLMIDPDRKASEWLRAYAKQIKSVSQDDPCFTGILSEAITRGGHCVVQITKQMSSALHGLICRIDEDTPTIRFNESELTVSEQFKLHVSVSHSIQLTQELMDLFTVVSFEMGEQAIDRQLRMELLKKLNPEMLARQPEIIKRKVALRNELNNQQKALVGMFQNQFRGASVVSEKTLKDFQSIKSRVVELNRNIRQQSELLQQYKLPQLISSMTRVAHTFRRALEQFSRMEPGSYFSRWTKIPFYVQMLRDAVNLESVIDEKSLLLYLFRLTLPSLSRSEGELLATLIAMKLVCNSDELIECLLTSDNATLQRRMGAYDECSWIVAELSRNRKCWEGEVITSLEESTEKEYLLKVGDQPTKVFERLTIALVINSKRPARNLLLALVRTVLGEQYLQQSDVALTDILKHTNRLVLSHDDEISAYDYCKENYGQILRIRRPEQFQQLIKKGSAWSSHGYSEKPLVLVEDLPLDWFNRTFDQLEQFLKDTPVVISASKKELLNSPIRQQFKKVHLRSKQNCQLLKRIDKLSLDSDLIDKYSGSYHWQLHYLHQLLLHYQRRYKKSPSQYRCDEESRILREMLGLIDNLSSEFTTISKTLIKDELGYDESLEQWQCYHYLVWEVLFNDQLPQRYVLARTLLSRIGEERQYIIDRRVLTKRLSDADMDEYLGVDPKLAAMLTKTASKEFEQAVWMLYPPKIREAIKPPTDLETLERTLVKLTFTEKKSKDLWERVINEAKLRLYQKVNFVRERLRVLVKLQQGGHCTNELKTAIANCIPTTWCLNAKNGHLTLTTFVERLAYQYKHLEQLAPGSLVVDLSCISSQSIYLENYLRQLAKRNNYNLEDITLAFCRIEGDRETADGLTISNVHATCSEWDRRGRCLTISYNDSTLSELELVAIQKCARSGDLPTSGSICTGSVPLALYSEVGDSQPLLYLEVTLSPKTTIMKETFLSLGP